MKKATELLSQQDKQRIESRIGEVESQRNVEIVCACSTESGRYDRAEGICGLVVAIIALCLANYVVYTLQTVPGSWATVQLHLGWQVLAVVLGFIAGNVMASYVHPVRRLFVSRKMLAQEVDRSAHSIVRLERISELSHWPGLLIYVSCFEKRLLVLENQQLEKIVQSEFIERLCTESTALLREGKFVDAFVHAIDRLDEQLKHAERSAIPGEADSNPDIQGLHNHLLIFHPRPA